MERGEEEEEEREEEEKKKKERKKERSIGSTPTSSSLTYPVLLPTYPTYLTLPTYKLSLWSLLSDLTSSVFLCVLFFRTCENSFFGGA
jgi:hypothetical protein